MPANLYTSLHRSTIQIRGSGRSRSNTSQKYIFSQVNGNTYFFLFFFFSLKGKQIVNSHSRQAEDCPQGIQPIIKSKENYLEGNTIETAVHIPFCLHGNTSMNLTLGHHVTNLLCLLPQIDGRIHNCAICPLPYMYKSFILSK